MCSHKTKTEECAAERTRDRTLTQRDRTRSASVRTPTRNRNSRHECRDPNTTLQHKQGMQTRERTARAHSKPHTHIKTGHDGSVRALSQIKTHTQQQTRQENQKHRDKEGREGGGGKPVPQDTPRRSQVSREGREG